MKILKSLTSFKRKLVRKFKLFWFVIIKDSGAVFIENGEDSFAHVPDKIRPMEEFLDKCINTIENVQIEEHYKNYKKQKP